jgi:hypothetical protein
MPHQAAPGYQLILYDKQLYHVFFLPCALSADGGSCVPASNVSPENRGQSFSSDVKMSEFLWIL